MTASLTETVDEPAGDTTPVPSPHTPSLVRRVLPYWPLVLIALGAFVLRLGVLGTIREVCDSNPEIGSAQFQAGECFALAGDTEYVTVQAHELQNGHGFVRAEKLMHGTGTLDEPGAAHPPLYTYFLAILQSSGFPGAPATEPVDPNSLLAWRTAMAFVGSIGVGAMGLAAWRLAGSRTASTGPKSRRLAMVAAGIGAVNPLMWSRDTDMLVEGFLILLVPLAIVAALRVWRRPTWLNAILLGFVIGLAWLTRTEQITLLVFMAPLFWWGLRPLATARRVGLFVAAFVVACLMMSPWSFYNFSRFERPVPLSTNGGLALLFGTCDDTYYGPRATPDDPNPRSSFGYYDWYCVERIATEPDRDESVHERQRTQAALDYMAEHPTRVPVVMAARFGRFWRVYEIGDTTDREAIDEGAGWIAAQSGLVALYVLTPFAVVGAIALRRRGMPLSPLLAPIVISSLAATLLIPLPRFRVPADVVIVLLATFGFAPAYHWVRQRFSSS